MYKLYYIRGINRLDTPYFKTINEQVQFFESNKIIEIDYIYPPHYQDTIDFDINDLDMNTKANYLSIDFNNKTYYYFIDTIRYINEEMIQISITMDVVQTYMFNIDFTHSDIDRRLIDRWTNNGINRNYIRENLSNGDMVYEAHYMTVPNIVWLVCRFKIVSKRSYSTKDYQDKKVVEDILEGSVLAQDSPSILQTSFNTSMILNSDSAYLLRPISLNNKNILLKSPLSDNFYGDVTIKPLNVDDIIQLGKFENVVSIRCLPFNPFVELEINETSDLITITSSKYDKWTPYKQYYISTDGGLTDIGIIKGFCSGSNSIGLQEQISPNIYNSIHFLEDFNQNTNIKISFNRDYVPALLDENYVQIQYGEKISLTGVPLYQFNQLSLFGHKNYDLVSGTRIYYVSQVENVSLDDYKTLIYVTTEEGFSLYNNAWNTYLAQNQATLTTGVRLNHEKNIYQTIKGIIANPKDIARTGSDAIFNAYNIQQRLNIAKDNLQFTPDTIKYGNSVNSDLLTKSLYECVYCYVVNDIDKVAEQYEGYGYKVNEHYGNVNIIDELNTRYYYNVIKCSSLDLNLNILNDETTIMRIKERFINGLRFWNISNLDDIQMGDLYVYDNVEKKYITNK